MLAVTVLPDQELALAGPNGVGLPLQTVTVLSQGPQVIDLAGWCFTYGLPGTLTMIVSILILSLCEQDSEDHRADATLTAERPFR